MEERARGGDHLLITAAQRSCRLAAPFREPREVGEDALELGLDRAAPRVSTESEVLPDGELRECAAALRHVGDAEARDVVGAGPVEGAAGKPDAPRAAHSARDSAERRRLAGAVRAEHRDDRSLLYRERDPVQRMNGAIAGLDVLELEQGGHAASSPPR